MSTTGTPIEGWLQAVWDRRGTDLHVSPGTAPVMRVDGVLQPIPGERPLTHVDTDRLVRAVLGDLAKRLDDGGDVDFSFSWADGARFRGNAFWQRGSLSMALRMIPFEIPRPSDIGLPAVVVDRLLALPAGLVIVTGPTGSGKSTSLASMVDHINRTRSCHILTIEDPIEHLHHHERSVVNQREVGTDVDSFPTALRAALREDPDVLLVGEMRDLTSIETTLTIAETGHLVFATLHTNDTSQAIDRIIDVFPAERRDQIQVQLAAALQGVIYQRLLPRAGGQGQVAAFEVLIANHAVRNLIREGQTRQLRNAVATGTREGMQTFEQALSTLVQSGKVTHDDAVAVSLHPKEVARDRAA